MAPMFIYLWFCFPLNPPRSFPVPAGCDHAPGLRSSWGWVFHPSLKYICLPFRQFMELSAISGPARPQMGPVKAEMERDLSGRSRPHWRGTGISARFDGFRRRCTGGSWRKAQRLLRAGRSVRPVLFHWELGKYFSNYWERLFMFLFTYKLDGPQLWCTVALQTL